MPATILALATEVPKTILTQERFQEALKFLLRLTDQEVLLLKKITKGSRIEKRHTIVTDFVEKDFQGNFFGGKREFPQTKKRNEIYKYAAPDLAESVCQHLLQEWNDNPKKITHVISVSCTGMIAPGIELLLVDRLGLSPEVERLGINFMGCFGAFKGLAIAKALALENQAHRILVVCTELCSLHFQEDHSKDSLVANALFADGAAAAIVGMPNKGERCLFEMHHQSSMIVKNTLGHMTWEAGDYGYQMRLSEEIPSNLENHIFSFVQRLTQGRSLDQCSWAIHPGGKAILESIARACNLQKEQLFASWRVLQDYGNMSSPTFLFVLKELFLSATPAWVVGLGFGPGLSVEGLLLKRV